ncbi:MAG: VWA domain-containing protein, partial [Armatimonadetes bacterium]|nr:VWA domain-containing protein [Armatimonadota bacterium]
MGILSPWMLLGLLSVPTIVVLYLLRLKRRAVQVPSVLLWRQVVDDHQANAPFQRLRRNLLMFVQIVVALLLVGAAVRPYKLVPGMGGKRTVVVLDASASMQATDVKPNRFEGARAVVRRMIDHLGPGDQMALVVVGQRARTACSLTANRQTLRAALAGVAAEDTHGNLKDGAAVA